MSLRYLALAAGVALVAIASARYSVQGEAKGAPASVVRVASALARSLEYRPNAGQRLVYTFERHLRVSGENGEVAPIDYSGELSIDVLDSQGEEIVAMIESKIAGRSDAGKVRLPFRLSVAADRIALGKAMTTREPSSVGTESNILKDLLCLWAFPLQQDTVGSYSARIATDAQGIVSKEKLAYAKPNTPKILSSSHQMGWRAEVGAPEWVRGTERSRTGTGPMDLSFETSYAMRFARVETARVDETSKSAAAQAQFNEEPLRLASTAPSDRPVPRWEDVAHELARAETLTRPERLSLLGETLRFLRSPGASVQPLRNLLTAGVIQAGPASPLFRLAVGAMASLGSKEAQAALVDIYHAPEASVSGKGMILASLTTTQAQLNPDTQAFLQQEAFDGEDSNLSSGALWALGSSLQNSGDSPRAQATIAALLEQWSKAATSDQRANLLDAMGNSGRGEFIDALKGVVSSQASADLRAKAVFALRFMQSPAAGELMIQEVSDTNPAMRLAAANALGAAGWQERFLAPLQACAESDSVESVRQACKSAIRPSGA